MRLRLPPPRPLGRVAAVLWGFVIPVLALLPPVAFGVFLYGLDALATSVLLEPCMGWLGGGCGGGNRLCGAARWLSAWWWLLAGLFGYPIWAGAVVWLVRRLAAPGYRWRLAGSVLWMSALPVFAESFAGLAGIYVDSSRTTYFVFMVVSAALSAAGLWLAFRPLENGVRSRT